MFNPFITSQTAHLSFSSPSGDAVSIELSLKDIPADILKEGKTLTGELSARKPDGSYILTLTKGGDIPVKISPALPLGTKFIATLDAQGKPLSGQFIQPNTPHLPQNTQNPQNNSPSLNLPHSSQYTKTPQQTSFSKTAAEALLNKQTSSLLLEKAWISIAKNPQTFNGFSKHTPVHTFFNPESTLTLKKIDALFSNNAQITALLLPQEPESSAPQTYTKMLKGIEIPAKTKPIQALLFSKEGTPFKNPIPVTLYTKLTENLSQTQLVSFQKSSHPTHMRETVNAPLVLTPSKTIPFKPQIQPIIPQENIQPLTTTQQKQLAEKLIILNKPENLPDKAPLQLQIITAPKAGDIQAPAQHASTKSNMLTQHAILPSGQTVTLKTPFPINVGTSFTFIPEQTSPNGARIDPHAPAFKEHTFPQNTPLPATVSDHFGKDGVIFTLNSGKTVLFKSSQPLPIGLSVLFTQTSGKNVVNISHIHANATQASTQEIMTQLSTEWQALKQAISTLKDTPFDTHIHQNIPQLKQTFIANIPFFLNAVKEQLSEKWLGHETTQLLKALGVDLNADLSKISQLMQKTETPEGWRGVLFPYYETPEHVKQGSFFWKKEQKQDKHTAGTHFIVDVSFSQLGDIQLNGFFRQNTLTLQLLHRKNWDKASELRIEKQIHHILAHLSLAGSVHISQQYRFEKQHLESFNLNHSQINLMI